MKMYPFPDNAITKTALPLLLTVLLLTARDTLINSLSLGFYVCYAITIGAVYLAGLSFLIVHRYSMKEIFLDKRMLLILLSTVVVAVPMLAKRDLQLMYISILLCLYIAVFLSYFLTLQQAARYYVGIMTALSVYALFALAVLTPLTQAGVLEPPLYVNSAGSELYSYGLAFVRPPEKVTFLRSYGVFREPGVHQYFLVLAMVLNNFCAGWKRERTVWTVNAILGITVLASMSTNGIIEMALLLGLVFFRKKLYKKRWIAILTAAAAVLLAAAVIYSLATESFLYSVLNKIFSKLFTLNSSSRPRLKAIMADLEIIRQHPLVGAALADVITVVKHNTTSTMILFAGFGLTGGLFHLLGWAMLAWNREEPWWVGIVLFVIFLLSFNTQNLIGDTFFWLFPMLALAERGLPLLKKRGK